MPSSAEIREHLDRVLESPGLRGSERLVRFLRFTVEAKLNGDEGTIKEYLIGREVFDRGEDYDPRLDPIVRVEARRLRKKLDEYYSASPPEAGGLRITFPKGSYTPEFVSPAVAPLQLVKSPSRRLAFGLLLAAAFGFAMIWWLRPSKPEQLELAVVPARWIWRTEDFPASRYDEDLAELTAAELAMGNSYRVIAWPALQKFRRGGYGLRQIAAELSITKVLVVAVRVEADGFRVTAYMIDTRSDRKLGVTDLRSQPLETMEQRRAVAAKLAKAAAVAATAHP